MRRPEIEEFYETIGGGGFSSASLNEATTIDGFGAPSRLQGASSSSSGNSPAQATTTSASIITTTTNANANSNSGDLYGSRLSAGNNSPQSASENESTTAASQSQSQSQRQNQEQSAASRQQAQAQSQSQAARQPAVMASVMEIGQIQPVMVPVTYLTTMTYLTTVVHGTHTLETSHESLVKSTELATLNAQLMEQIEHKLPLIEPTATVSLSSKTKGKGTTIVNLKSAVSAYNEELVEALGVANVLNSNQASSTRIQPTALLELPLSTASPQATPIGAGGAIGNRLTSNKFKQPNRQRQRPGGAGGSSSASQQAANSALLDLSDLQEAKKSLITEFVYMYTIKPVDLGNSAALEPATTSIRSEFVTASQQPPVLAFGSAPGSVESADQLLSKLANGHQSAAANGAGHLIDSNGILRINQALASSDQLAPINLGKCFFQTF